MIPVLYRDDQLVIVDKPPGWLVHRTALDRHESKLVLQAVRDQVGQTLWPVHRLDKGTSGVLVFALDAATAAAMGAIFQSGDGLGKQYRAIVRGWPADHLVIDHPLRRLSEDMRADRSAVQSAVTRLQTIRRGDLPIAQGTFPTLRWAELALEPLSGRRHQLRRHLKHISHPIIGDSTYGKGPINRAVAANRGVQRLWLHLEALRFKHPVTESNIEVVASLPPQWSDAWADRSISSPVQHRIPGNTE